MTLTYHLCDFWNSIFIFRSLSVMSLRELLENVKWNKTYEFSVTICWV